MSIDRIGKGGVPGPVPAAPAVGAARAGDVFSLGKPGAAAAAGVAPVSSVALEQLRSGAIDLGRYLDIKVAEATEHLAMLAPAELDAIQGALRERLASDPGLVELVNAAARASASAGPNR